MADDLGFSDLDWKDDTLYTPNIRSLAFHQNSVQLTNSYVNQLCTPTRSAFMTGYYPFRVGTQNGVFLHMEPSGVPLLFPFVSENLRSLGYSTYLIGKWHLDQWHRELRRVVRGVDLFEEVGDGVSTPDFSQDGVYSTELFADAAMELIDVHNSSKPFFTFLSFQAVHPPLQVPKKFEKYCYRIKSKARRIYCGMLTAMDFAIGRVIDFLKSTGHYEDTNGGTAQFGASNWPLRGEKDSLWEGGTKTTTIVHAPKHIKETALINGTTLSVDYHVLDVFNLSTTSMTMDRRYEDPGESHDISRLQPAIVRRLLNKILDLQKYMRRNVRKPLSILGNPELLNGSYASGWCT
ncbi:arylsulfatase [Ancylostoma ceylanicum]|uniref:Arylsulfatase n=1 Tax=Ancylostoma ceylanicum TaxID=53326 RepID=A0A0D6LP98_9BILA|nr:arylsulfatase [Ancylostoma ceylanicum]